MKKISYYLMAIVAIGVATLSYWIYQKYFKVERQNFLVFQALRGDIRETVKARGEVVAQKDFALEFPFGGTVERVYVTDGQTVKSGAALMKLDTRELELEKSRLLAIVAQREAARAKLIAGASSEDVRVSEAKVASAERALMDARTALLDADRSAFTQADDAIHSKSDQFFSNPRSVHPTLNFTLSDSQLKTTLEANRADLEQMITSWGINLPGGIAILDTLTLTTNENLAQVRAFLGRMAMAVNNLSPTVSTAQATLDAWRADVVLARTNIDTAITTVVTAEEKMRTAESALALAQSELSLKKSAARTEDLALAQAQIEESQAALAATEEKISKATLRAPGAGVIKKVNLEQGEVFKPGVNAVSFVSSGYKIQSDISELDIGKVRYTDGSEASIRFDAFPEKTFNGKVVFIEPQEVIKDEDVYFRTDIFLEHHDESIRSGMSADVVLYGVSKKAVLRVPELAVYKKGDKSFVKVARGVTRKEDVQADKLTEVEVVTGIADGELTEVVQGLQDNEFVVVAAD